MKGGKVLPKVLVLEDETMKMFFLEELDLETVTGIRRLMKISVVRYVCDVVLTAAFYYLFMPDHPSHASITTDSCVIFCIIIIMRSELAEERQ